MHIVAIRTQHPATGDRMGRQHMRLGALRLVAGKTELLLRVSGESTVLRLVDLMARCAGEVGARVGTALPMDAFARLMAIQAGPALHVHGRRIQPAKYEIGGWPIRCLVRMLHMRSARAMAGLAARLRCHSVARETDRQDRFLVVGAMATRADSVAAGPGLEDHWRLLRLAGAT